MLPLLPLPLLLLPLLWGGSLQEQQQPGRGIQMQESVSVQEGGCTIVPCSFPSSMKSLYPSSKIYINWYQSQYNPSNLELVATNDPERQVNRETESRFFLMDPRANNCSLSIRDVRKSDAGTYIFRVEKEYFVRYTYQEKKLTLQVTDLTQKPDIHIWGPLESGRPTQLSCSLPGSCEGGRPLIFSWVGSALHSLNTHNLRSSVLTFTPKPWDHSTKVTCLVTLAGPGVTTQKTIRLNVSYGPQNLTIGMAFRNLTALKVLQTTSLLILEGESLRLLCEADSNPPAQLSWFRRSPALNAGQVSSTAVLELPRVGTGEEGRFTCQARHPLGSRSISLSLSVVYPPRLLGPSCSWEDEGLNCSCSSRAQPAPSLRWRFGEGLLEWNPSNASYMVTSSSAGPWANSSLSLRAGLSSGLRLSCEAANVHGAQSASVLLLPAQAACECRAVPGALGGAGAMVLLSLCLCLISFCMMKFRRKRPARGQKVTNDEDPVMATVTWGSPQNPQPDRPPDQLSPMEDASPSGEEQDTPYANLRFHRGEPCEAQDKEATSTCVYSEIKKTNLTQKPDIHIRAPLESGRPTQLSCSLPGSCEGGRPLRFSWVGDALDSLNPDALRSSALTFTPKPSDDGTKVTCRVTLAGSRVTTQKTIWLNVSYPPQLLGPSCSWEDESLSCSCSSQAQPAPSLRWRLGEGLLEENRSKASYTVTSSSAGPWANSSLSLRAGLSSGLRLSCEARNVHEVQSASVLLLPGHQPGEQQGSWPLILTLIRGALMGVGFLLTYGLTWLYYTR
ncbi:sialic acid-binding Ig-like lectin 5 [Glossophaga mutica]